MTDDGKEAPDSDRWTEGLMRINNEQANELRETRRALERGRAGESMSEEALFDELTRVNNDFANLQRELVRANTRLQQLNEEKNRFLGMAAHDLRTPLGVISSYAEFLEEEATERLTEEEVHFVQLIRRTGDFLLRMVNELLDVASIEAGRLELRVGESDLMSLVRNTVRLISPIAAAKSVELKVADTTEIEPFYFDPDRVEQVLHNLLGNAVKFSEKNDVVNVRLDQDGDDAWVHVEDEGVGIPEDLQSQLFQPFGGASRPGTAGEEGTGLGLAIVRRIVEAHGGVVRVKSRVGEGTTFSFSLPLVR
ncbi:MAG: HAMP domain-containing sensor histidine kinase [Gemmatimonadota bacterium]|nr:HAMP domain-containing sensor histidine kinase [Gemmatimonadota bacterium]